MNSMIERVARAIYESTYRGFGGVHLMAGPDEDWGRLPPEQKERCYIESKAAILAMRDPTDSRMSVTYDDHEGELILSSGKRIYCFGGNPSLRVGYYETLDYAYGSDGGFSVGTGIRDISIADAIEIADCMIETWKRHREYLESKI